jgi:hypothetical protein
VDVLKFGLDLVELAVREDDGDRSVMVAVNHSGVIGEMKGQGEPLVGGNLGLACYSPSQAGSKYRQASHSDSQCIPCSYLTEMLAVQTSIAGDCTPRFEVGAAAHARGCERKMY